MADEFRWNEWNLEHATKHGVSPAEAEQVVNNPGRGWPRKGGDQKLMVQGRGVGDRFVQVVYVVDPDGCYYIVHAMPLSGRRRGRQR